ncbi:MAG: hypothetical protein ABJA50_06780 [Chloroflexota bacterium]
MNLSPAEAELFYDAVDDYYGLWEAVMGMRNIYPDYDEIHLRDTAESTLRGLLSKGRIKLCRRTAFEPTATPLEASEIETILTDLRSWKVPSFDEVEICYTSTDEGQRATNHQRQMGG